MTPVQAAEDDSRLWKIGDMFEGDRGVGAELTMGNYTYRLSLWFEHPDADLATIPVQLGLPAGRIWKKGDPRTTPKGRLTGGVYPRSHGSIEFAGGRGR